MKIKHITNIMLKHFIDINSHQSINFNRLNNMIRDANAKISSSQAHAEFLKIVLRKEVRKNIGKLFFRRDKF